MTWGFSNPDGNFNILLTLKLKGKDSFEYFKDNPVEFKSFINEVFPESIAFMPHVE